MRNSNFCKIYNILNQASDCLRDCAQVLRDAGLSTNFRKPEQEADAIDRLLRATPAPGPEEDYSLAAWPGHEAVIEIAETGPELKVVRESVGTIFGWSYVDQAEAGEAILKGIEAGELILLRRPLPGRDYPHCEAQIYAIEPIYRNAEQFWDQSLEKARKEGNADKIRKCHEATVEAVSFFDLALSALTDGNVPQARVELQKALQIESLWGDGCWARAALVMLNTHKE